MAATSSKPEVPTFSYAQAAKGLHAPPQPTKPVSAELGSESPNQDEQKANSSAQNAEPVTADTDAPRDAEKPAAGAEKESEPVPASKPKPNASGTSSPSVGTASTSAIGKDDDTSNTPNGTSDSTWDKQSQASVTEKPSKSAEGAKGKSKSTSEKSGKSKEPPKELKAAPLPSVNIWQQRREAQEAKAKTVPATQPTDSTVQKISAAEDQQDLSKSVSKKKDGMPDSKDRKKSDGRKGRDDDLTLSAAGDAAAWPTPQVAQGEEKRKAQEKGEKSEKGDKSPVIRPHGREKWMPVPYVPTAVFNTPLPSSGRRGGRAARGGRDGGRSAAVVGGSPDKPSSPGTKHPTSADRGRNEQGARANSLPAQARRSNSIDAAKSGDPRKTSQPASRGPKGADDGPAGKENFPRSRDAKPFQKNNEFGMRDNVRNPRLNVDGPRRFENGPKSADAAGFQGDYKDNHFRESRADRGRGGHRGRGHPGYPGSHNQFTHMQHPFSHPKSFGFNDRQRAVPNGSQGPRVPLRSPSLQNSTMYGVYPFPADINTMYGYPPMQSGPMSAVPYQQYMEPFSLMSMISMQLEYYFSVDNLCKDLFLRKHMDSQGFVALSFIAGFKRVKTLTEDFDFLRHVCRHLRNVEYQAGEDGVDRLRPKDKWEQWVLPMAQRDPAGQSEGPPPPKKLDEDHMDGHPNGSALPNGTGEHQPTAGGLETYKKTLSFVSWNCNPSAL